MRRAIPRHVPICGPPQDVDLSATAHPRTALAHTAALPHKIGKATAAQTRRDRHLGPASHPPGAVTLAPSKRPHHVQTAGPADPLRCRSLPISNTADRLVGSDPAAIALPSSQKA